MLRIMVVVQVCPLVLIFLFMVSVTVVYVFLRVGDYSATVTVPTDDADESNFTFVVAAKNLSRLENWRLLSFGNSQNSGAGADDVDPDGDGLDNLLEYALGGDPQLSDSVSLLPRLTINMDGRAEFHFTRDPSKTDVSYIMQVSDSLQFGSWADIASSTEGSVTSSNGDYGVSESGGAEINVTFTESEEVPMSRFFRLRVTSP